MKKKIILAIAAALLVGSWGLAMAQGSENQAGTAQATPCEADCVMKEQCDQMGDSEEKNCEEKCEDKCDKIED